MRTRSRPCATPRAGHLAGRPVRDDDGLLAHAVQRGSLPARVDVPGLLGPSESPPRSARADVPWPAFRDAVVAAADEMRVRAHVPARVFIGATPLAPADFLRAAATVIAGMPVQLRRHASLSRHGSSSPPEHASSTERFVAEDSPELFGGWVIHPDGFRAPRIVEMAKLQAWTLKPAER